MPNRKIKPPTDSAKPFQAVIRKPKPKIRLGLLGRNLLIRGENKRKFEELRANILKEIDPVSEIEKILCNKFISATFKHDRLIEIERNMLNVQNQPNPDDEVVFLFDPLSKPKKRIRNIIKVSLDKPDIQRVLEYQAVAEKNILKLLKRIREEQKMRIAKGVGDIVGDTVG